MYNSITNDYRRGGFMDRFDVPNRIKKYRSLLGISQSQLAGNKLSLSLLKSIESGRRKLTPLKANEIVESIKEIALSKDICIDIDASEFLMSNKDYARNYCLKKLDILCNSHDEKEYGDLISIANEYDLDDIKISIYSKSGIYFFSVQKYSDAIKSLQNAYDVSVKINDVITSLILLVRIGACYFCIGEIENSFEYYTKCYNGLTNKGIHNASIEFPLFYNLAAYYKKLDNYTLALELLEKSISLENLDETRINHSMLLKANILLLTENCNEALNIYKYLLKHNTQYIHIVYHNMAQAFNKLKDHEKSITYLNQSINMQLENNESTITLSLMDLGEIYFEDKKYTEAIIFHQYALDSCIRNNQPEYIYKCCNILLNLYKITNKTDNFNQYAIMLIRICLNNPGLKVKFSCFLFIVIKYLLQSNTI